MYLQLRVEGLSEGLFCCSRNYYELSEIYPAPLGDITWGGTWRFRATFCYEHNERRSPVLCEINLLGVEFVFVATVRHLSWFQQSWSNITHPGRVDYIFWKGKPFRNYELLPPSAPATNLHSEALTVAWVSTKNNMAAWRTMAPVQWAVHVSVFCVQIQPLLVCIMQI